MIVRASIWPKAGAALAGAGAVLAAGAVILAYHDLGPQARHMGLHIATMNLAAPVLAAIAVLRWPRYGASPCGLWIAALAQIAALWISHAPPVQAAMVLPLVAPALHGVLLLAAFCFWTLMLALPQVRRWHAVAALLLTAKLVCLLAALMVLAPRALYGHGAVHALDDQQLAGLLMIAACPLSYLVAAVVITVQLIGRDQADAGSLPARVAG